MNPTTPSKQAYCNALRAFISQRSGIDSRNYGDRKSFMGDYRRVLRDGKQARELLNYVQANDSINVEMIEEASKRAFMGRLSFEVKENKVAVSYVTGQYFVTEYRAATCAVLASAIWAHIRANLPAPSYQVGGRKKHTFATMEEAQRQANMFLPNIVSIEESYDGLSAGDYIRKQARELFGRGMAKDWFN